MNGGGALIPLAGLFECTSQRNGRRYFTGYLGRAKLLLMEVPEAEREEGKPTWTLFIAERSERQAAQPSASPRPRRRKRPAAAGGAGRPFNDDLPI